MVERIFFCNIKRAGIYEGTTSIAQLREHGDFGLGTFDQLDGELIAFDQDVYQLKSDGSANPATMEQKTPFAVMTFFNGGTDIVRCQVGIEKTV